MSFAQRSDFKRITIIVFTFLIFLCLTNSGYTLENTKGNKVIFIIWDGTRGITVNEMLKDEQLPNLGFLVRRGMKIEYGVTVFPSTTGPAYAPFVTGNLVSKSHLPGIRWFNRKTGKFRVYCGSDTKGINGDMNPEFKTIYELLDEKDSMAVFGMTDRGCKNSEMPVLSLAIPKLTGNFNEMDRKLFDLFLEKYEKNNFPAFSFLSLHSPDSEGHGAGIHGQKYKDHIKYLDDMLGELIHKLKAQGIFEKTTIIITSDHGLSSTDKNVDLQNVLKETLGLKIHNSIARLSQTWNLEYKLGLKDFDVIFAVSGNSFVMVYLKDPETGKISNSPAYKDLIAYPVPGNNERINVIKKIADLEFVRLTIAKDGEQYRILSRNGESIITKSNGSYKYDVISGDDPLQYGGIPSVYNRFISTDEWLELTCDQEFPDSVFQIASLFDYPGTGDLVFIAEKGWEPWNEGQKGVHGSLQAEEFHVPIIISGNMIKKGILKTGRTADLFPISCELLGIRPQTGIDGRKLDIFENKIKYIDSRTGILIEKIAKSSEETLIAELKIEQNRNKGLFDHFNKDGEKKIQKKIDRLNSLKKILKQKMDMNTARSIIDMGVFAGGKTLDEATKEYLDEKNKNSRFSITGFFKKLVKPSREKELQKLVALKTSTNNNIYQLVRRLSPSESREYFDEMTLASLREIKTQKGRISEEENEFVNRRNLFSDSFSGEILLRSNENLEISPSLREEYRILYEKYVELITNDPQNHDEISRILEEMKYLKTKNQFLDD